jgi:O-antigen ligase
MMAHNSYLELALALGVPAAALLMLALAAPFLRCLIGARDRRRDAVYPYIGVGATVLVAAHSAVDFSLQIPALAATYALIMAVAVAQSWRRAYHRGRIGGHSACQIRIGRHRRRDGPLGQARGRRTML